MGIYQSSGRTRNPLGALAVAVGMLGACASIILWAYQYDPTGALVRSVASKLGPGLVLGDALVLFAAIFGAIAVLSAIALSFSPIISETSKQRWNQRSRSPKSLTCLTT